ncbi:MAG: DNA-directed RNA polymerase subunit omega [Bacillota bacterium]
MSDKIKENTLPEENRYTLVMVAAKRARQLVEGSTPRVESKANKPVTIALDEITAEKIKFRNPSADSFK